MDKELVSNADKGDLGHAFRGENETIPEEESEHLPATVVKHEELKNGSGDKFDNPTHYEEKNEHSTGVKGANCEPSSSADTTTLADTRNEYDVLVSEITRTLHTKNIKDLKKCMVNKSTNTSDHSDSYLSDSDSTGQNQTHTRRSSSLPAVFQMSPIPDDIESVEDYEKLYGKIENREMRQEVLTKADSLFQRYGVALKNLGDDSTNKGPHYQEICNICHEWREISALWEKIQEEKPGSTIPGITNFFETAAGVVSGYQPMVGTNYGGIADKKKESNKSLLGCRVEEAPAGSKGKLPIKNVGDDDGDDIGRFKNDLSNISNKSGLTQLTEASTPFSIDSIPESKVPGVFIWRDYSNGMEAVFDTNYPTELEGFVTPRQFHNTMVRVNSILKDAEAVNCRTAKENVLTVVTCNLIECCRSTWTYGMYLDMLVKLIDEQNTKVYLPRRLKIMNPRLNGLRFIEIAFLDNEFRNYGNNDDS